MWLEEGTQPRQHPGDVGQELQTLAAQHGVEAGLLEFQLLCVTLDDLEVVEPLGVCSLAPERQHLP
jgi:hypothetical protein